MALKRHRHYGTNIIIAYLLIAMVVFPLPLPDPIYFVLVGILALLLVVGQSASLWHSYGDLCEKCISTMPLNPQAKAERQKRFLQTFHRMYGSPRRTMVTSAIQAALAVGTLASAFLAPDVVTSVLLEVMLLDLLVVHVTGNSHRKYQPWCPWCRDDGGHGDVASAPGPTITQPA